MNGSIRRTWTRVEDDFSCDLQLFQHTSYERGEYLSTKGMERYLCSETTILLLAKNDVEDGIKSLICGDVLFWFKF